MSVVSSSPSPTSIALIFSLFKNSLAKCFPSPLKQREFGFEPLPNAFSIDLPSLEACMGSPPTKFLLPFRLIPLLRFDENLEVPAVLLLVSTLKSASPSAAAMVLPNQSFNLSKEVSTLLLLVTTLKSAHPSAEAVAT